MTEDDVGGYYQDAQGDVWRLVGYASEPTATLERMDPFETAREEGRTAARVRGVVGAPIFEGFRKLAPETAHEAPLRVPEATARYPSVPCANCGQPASSHAAVRGFGLVCPVELAARTDEERFTYTPYLEPPPDVPANVRAALEALRPFEEQARKDLADADHVEWAFTRSQDGNEGFIVSVERAILDAIGALTDDDSA